MWAVTSSLIAAGCVLSAVSSSCPNYQSGNPPFPIMVLCLSARAPRYPQQGWSPASSSRNGVYWKATEQLWLLQGRQDDGQPGTIPTDSGARVWLLSLLPPCSLPRPPPSVPQDRCTDSPSKGDCDWGHGALSVLAPVMSLMGTPPTNVPLSACWHVCHGLGSLSNWCFILNSRVWSPG